MTIVTARLKSLPYSAQSPVSGADKPILTISWSADTENAPAVNRLKANRPTHTTDMDFLIIAASLFRFSPILRAGLSPVIISLGFIMDQKRDVKQILPVQPPTTRF
jgi:hypothetical protein